MNIYKQATETAICAPHTHLGTPTIMFLFRGYPQVRCCRRCYLFLLSVPSELWRKILLADAGDDDCLPTQVTLKSLNNVRGDAIASVQ